MIFSQSARRPPPQQQQSARDTFFQTRPQTSALSRQSGATAVARAQAFLNSRSSSSCLNTIQTAAPPPRPQGQKPVRRIQMNLYGKPAARPRPKPKGKGRRAEGGRVSKAFSTMSDDEDACGDDISGDDWSDKEDGELSDGFCVKDDAVLSEHEWTDEEGEERDPIDELAARELAEVSSDSDAGELPPFEDSDDEWLEDSARKAEEEKRKKLRRELKRRRRELEEKKAAENEKGEGQTAKPPEPVRLDARPEVLYAFFKVADCPTDRSLAARSAQRNMARILEANFLPYDDPDEIRAQFERDYFASKPGKTGVDEMAAFNRCHAVYSQLAKLASTRRRMDRRELLALDRRNARRYARLMGEEPARPEAPAVVDLTQQKPRWIETRERPPVVVVAEEEAAPAALHNAIRDACENARFAAAAAFAREFGNLLRAAADADRVGFASAGRVHGEEWWIATDGRGAPRTRAVRVPRNADPRLLRFVARALRLRDAVQRLGGGGTRSGRVLGWFPGPRDDIRAKQAVALVPCPGWMEGLLQRTGAPAERDLRAPTRAQLEAAIAALAASSG